MKISAEVGKKLVKELHHAPYVGRGEIIKRYMEMTGKSYDTIYRLAKKHGYQSGRKKRKDSGQSTLSREHVLEAAKMIKKTQRQKKTMIMPATRARQILEDSGKIPEVSSSTLNRQLRAYNISKRDMATPAPHVSMRSLYSNHVQQFDSSNCVQYFLDSSGALAERDIELLYKNKIKNFKKIKKELLRYIMVDHKSGAMYVRYFYAEGENTADQLDFFYLAWSKKEEKLHGPGANPAKFPFCGVPDMLVTDRGSALTSAIAGNLLDRLGVKLHAHKTNNSRAKGTVERSHWLWEEQFESGLREKPAPDLDTLNAWALDFALCLNATMIHSRHGFTRNAMWLKCIKQLRLPPELDVFRELALSNAIERKVSGSLTISFKNDEYSLRHIPGIRRKDNIEVYSSPYKQNAVIIKHQDQQYTAYKIEKDISGQPLDAPVWGENYKSQKDSVTEKTVKEAQELETGSYQVYGHHAEKVTPLHYIPVESRPIEIKREVVKIPILRAMRRVSDVLGRPISKKENERIREIYGSSIAEEEIKQITAWLSGEDDGKEKAKRASGGQSAI
jgi:hypothetical protein